MAISPMQASMGVDIAGAVGGFFEGRIASKLAGKLQKYRNEMLKITAMMSENVNMQNRIATRDANVRVMLSISAAAAEDRGRAEVSAAAAGVRGGSVDRTMRGLRRSAANAQAARKARAAGEMKSHANELKNIRVSAIMGRDITVQTKPSLLSSLNGLSATLADTFDRFQPEGEKLGDILKGKRIFKL